MKQWSAIQKVLGEGSGKPILHNKRGTEIENPFSPTLFYGYPNGLIFEVMKNDHIATVCIYNSL
jgi:hypothetical protein